jgi:hypothetical protein
VCLLWYDLLLQLLRLMRLFDFLKPSQLLFTQRQPGQQLRATSPSPFKRHSTSPFGDFGMVPAQ